jgi:hypothetical protein
MFAAPPSYMPAYKKQHYLPVAYLSQFGRPLEREPRQRLVWRVSESHAGEVHVNSQCQEDYFYSKSHARLCEGYFDQIETIYGSLLARLGRGETLTASDLFRFFLCAVDFYARGAKFRANSEREEFELYLHRTAIFKRQLISQNLTEATDDARRDFLLASWQFCLVSFSADAALLTSDSPSIWLGSSQAPQELHGVVMPVTPLSCFVGARRTTYSIASTVAEPIDAVVMNRNQIENCADAVFCSEALSAREVAGIRKQLAIRQVAPSRADGWQLELIDYDLNPNLSFLVT